jgi:uncharacterized protein (TIGR02996 family)
MTDLDALTAACLEGPDDEARLAVLGDWLEEHDDRQARLAYADWLEERGDPRAEYLRLQARLAAIPVGHEAAAGARRRLLELRARLPPWWLALLGEHCSTGSEPGPGRLELAARVLGRPAAASPSWARPRSPPGRWPTTR